METVLLRIEGMSCEGCVKRVRGAIEKAGAEEGSEAGVGWARVVFDEEMRSVATFVHAVEKLGFDVQADETGGES